MPFANFVYGERARATTLVLVEEVVDGGWGIGGNLLTAAMLAGDQLNNRST